MLMAQVKGLILGIVLAYLQLLESYTMLLVSPVFAYVIISVQKIPFAFHMPISELLIRIQHRKTFFF